MSDITLLWPMLAARLHPSERDEVMLMLGTSRIERNQSVADEIKALLDICSELSISDSLFDLNCYQDKISFFIEHLRGKAEKAGLEPDILIPVKTPRERELYEIVTESSTRPSSRIGRSDSSLIEIHAQTVLSKLPERMDVFSLETLVKDLQKSLDEEYAGLVSEASQLQQQVLSDAQRPKLSKDMHSFTKKLEKAYMTEIPRAIMTPSKPRRKLSSTKPQQSTPVIKKTYTEEDFFGLDPELFDNIQLDFSKPKEICKPKVRTISKPVFRPPSPAVPESAKSSELSRTSTSRMARRLRSMINSHRELGDIL